jgi:hypothetical protein
LYQLPLPIHHHTLLFGGSRVWTQGLMLWAGATLPSLFSVRFFWNRLWTICPTFLQTWSSILLISDSWVARVTCMSHRCLIYYTLFSVGKQSQIKSRWHIPMSSHVPTNIHFCMLYYNVCIYIYIYIYVCVCVCFHISVMLFIHEAILNI